MTRSKRQRIVVVNDADAGVRRALTADLSKAGFTIVACSDGLSVLRHLAIGERADVLVIGPGRPAGGEHFCVVAEARRQRPDLPIVLMTARSSCKDYTWIACTTHAVLDCFGTERGMSIVLPISPSSGSTLQHSF